ncbi:MAG: DNA polymerase III subunit beta [Spirochaetes bacterium GWD1_27_9]|nr:MAG: DNA polymerase III subunit beta [Spirochaetes bacterium GWB1_27_13]OHD22442.1 MAG: DNA polymerase III subunit beta [Spirochaetes bacterium GWC1_27_15]OHD29352.1 MAG: DNA polymerase III subunit beta [Spirochaetes bacterium GWD1_27_9]
MKIICSKESLSKVLGVAEGVISTKNNISILSNVLIETMDNAVKISACEITLNFFAEIGAEVIEPGSISVYCNRLYSIIKKLNCEEIEITSDSQNTVTIRPKDNKRSLYTLKGINSEKFPPIRPSDSTDFFSINQEAFMDMIKKTLFAVPANDNKKFTSGVLFEKSNDSIKMVSTDGKRLCLVTKDITIQEIENTSIIVPPKLLTEVNKLCSGNGDIKITFNTKNIYVVIDNFYFISNLLEGNFPPYQKVIPQEQNNKAIANKKEFYESLDRISLMSDKDSKKIIISLSKDTMKIFTENATLGSGEEIIPVEYDNQEIKIALNQTFILEVLNVLQNDKVIIEFKDNQSTITIKELDNAEYLYVMMPMSF